MAQFLFMDYFIKALATWRLVNMIQKEDGPYEIFPRFLRRAGVRWDGGVKMGTNEFANMLVCKYCLSFWVGLLFTILPVKAALPFALSGAFLWLDRFNGKS